MIELHEFLPLIEPNAIKAPEPLTLQCLRLAAIRFCERTRLWRSSDIIETNGIDPEPIGIEPDSVLFEVAACAQGVEGDARPLNPITIAELARIRPSWRTERLGGVGGSRWYVCPEWGTIQAVQRAPGLLTVEIVLKPAITAQSLPDFLFAQYGTDLANGASGYVLAKPNVAFGNPQLAGALNTMFELRLGALSNMGSAGQQKGKARTRARFM